MEQYLVWLIAGFVLIIAELVTGTFYLLMLGVAAFAGGAVAWAKLSFWIQAVVAAVVAFAGAVWVYHWRRRDVREKMRPLDTGQPAVFESWVNREAGHARVKYRDALWEAYVEGVAEGQRGEVFYIVSVDGNTLKISKARPA